MKFKHQLKKNQNVKREQPEHRLSTIFQMLALQNQTKALRLRF